MVLEETSRVREIRHIEHSVASSLENANGIVDLLEELRGDNATSVAIAAMHSLRRVLTQLLVQKSEEILSSNDESKKQARRKLNSEMKTTQTVNPKAVYENWLNARFNDYIQRLLSWVRDLNDLNFVLPALRVLMGFVELHPRIYPGSPEDQEKYLLTGLFSEIIEALAMHSRGLDSLIQTKIVSVFGEEFVNAYDDVRYYMLIKIQSLSQRVSFDSREMRRGGALPDDSPLCLKAVSKSLSLEEFSGQIIQLLMCIFMVDEQADLTAFLVSIEKNIDDTKESNNSASNEKDLMNEQPQNKRKASKLTENASKNNSKVLPGYFVKHIDYHRKVLGDAWVSSLALPLPHNLYREVLIFLPERVIPYMNLPLRLADFFTQGYKQGGVNSILALDSLFLLMTSHKLSYPNFYDSLLDQIKPSTMYARYRSRLFRMLDVCLSSSQLSASLIATFMKRLLRVSLLAPPGAALYALALTQKLLRAHPQCQQMISREDSKALEGDEAVLARKAEEIAHDPPIALPKTISINENMIYTNSLWEILALRRHYHPAVSTVARGFAQKGLGSIGQVEGFTSITYKSLFDQEMKRKTKGDDIPLAIMPPCGLLVAPNGADGNAAFDVYTENFML